MQGTAEEQFAEIAAAAHAEALQDIDYILMDDDSVDYSAPRQQPLEPQVQIQKIISRFQTQTRQTIAPRKVLQTAHWTLRALKYYSQMRVLK